MRKVLVPVLMVTGLLMVVAAPAWACLATPAPDHAWETGNTEQNKKGEDGSMAPIMGDPDGEQDGGVVRADPDPVNGPCTVDMDWCVPPLASE